LSRILTATIGDDDAAHAPGGGDDAAYIGTAVTPWLPGGSFQMACGGPARPSGASEPVLGTRWLPLAIRVDGPRAAAESLVIDWHFTDTDSTIRLALSNGALIQTANPRTKAAADLTLALSKAQLLGVLAGRGLDGIQRTGDLAALVKLMTLLDTPDPAFPIVTP
jgi:Alkyl sulfatase C-terminal